MHFRRSIHRLLTLAVLALLAGCRAPAPAPEPAKPQVLPPPGDGIRYELSFADHAAHYVDVKAAFPVVDGSATVELMMAVWTPGSYLVREYARHVEAFTAQDPQGNPLDWRKTRKNRWAVTLPSDVGGSGDAGVSGNTVASLTVTYRVYGREMGVRTNWIDADMAVLNGAPTFLTPVGRHAEPREVLLRLPDGWEGTVTALAPHPSGEAHRYVARDYDELVDSPILAGNPEVHEVPVADAEDDSLLPSLAEEPPPLPPHYLVNHGDTALFDAEQAVEDVGALVRTQVDFWGVAPYEHYYFLNVIAESGGGLEHKASTLLMTGRFYSRGDGYTPWLGLVSHELFHTWNVKRLRPEPLGPFDYENEVYTPSLWVAEGITSYYGPLLLLRAGLIDEEKYLERLSDTVRRVQQRPGRQVQSLAEASYDTWIKHYRPDENSRNTSVDYYSRGAVVGFLLDAEIRRHTYNDKSLDDVMRLAYERYSGDRGYTPEDFEAAASEVAGEDLRDFFANNVESTGELDFTAALDFLGLRFKPTAKDDGEDDAEEDGDDAEKEEESEPGWLGFQTRDQDGRLVISRVPRDTPAWQQGFNVDDEILAVDGYRVYGGEWEQRMKHYPPDTAVEVLVSRRGQLRTMPARLGREPENAWQLEVDPDAGIKKERRREKWLSGER